MAATVTNIDERATWDVAAEASAEAQEQAKHNVDAIRVRCKEARRYTTLRQVPLDFIELAKLGQDVAEKLATIDTLKEKRKGLNAQIKDLKDEIDEGAVELRTGKGERELQVVEYHDEDAQHVYLVRLDTEEVIEDRTMTGAERQGHLDYGAQSATEEDDLDEELEEDGDAEPEQEDEVDDDPDDDDLDD